MKVDTWEEIVNIDEKFMNFPRTGIPLAYFSKEETHLANNYTMAVVIFEDKGKLYIGASNGDKINIPFNFIAVSRIISEKFNNDTKAN